MFKLFAQYAKKYKVSIVLAPIFKIFEAVFGLLTPIIVKNIIDFGINGTEGVEYILIQGAILLALAIVGFAMTMVCQFLSIKVATNYGYILRNELYAKINALSYKELDTLTTSRLETNLSNDLIATQTALMMMLRLAIRAPFIVIGSIILSIFIAPTLCWIFLLGGVLLGLIIFVIGFISIPYNSKIQSNLDDLTKTSEDNLTGSRVVRAFNKEEHERKRFFFTSASIEQISKRLARITSLSNPLNLLVINGCIVLILYLGSISVTNGTITQGDIVSLVNYMFQISVAIVVVANLIVIFAKGSSCAKRINVVLATQSSLKVGEDTIDENKPLDITFDDVTFAYNKDAKPALKNINITLKEGKSYGIIGGTGAGKSTFINLLNHFYDADEGAVNVQGKNIQSYDFKNLNEHIALVSQNPTLFSGTILDNLKFANEKVNDERIAHALKIAQCEDVVKAKGGLDAIVEEGGKNFSGGQKQRLTIARSLCKDARILILDDASSALDFKTDYELRKAIKENYKNNLVIYISQRVSSIKDVDEIICMKKGHIEGIGKHEELIKSCAAYRDICASQGMEVNGL